MHTLLRTAVCQKVFVGLNQCIKHLAHSLAVAEFNLSEGIKQAGRQLGR